MKKLSAFILPLLLLACDKTPTQEIKFKACCDMEKYGVMTLKISGDDIVLNIDNVDVKMKNTEDTEYKEECVNCDIRLVGEHPETHKTFFIGMDYNTETKVLHLYNFSDDIRHGYGVDILLSVELKGYKTPTAAEKCVVELNNMITTYEKNVFIQKKIKSCVNRISTNGCHTYTYDVPIETSDAIKISQDWNKEDFMTYNFDNIDAHKTDPCIAVSNLKNYINKQQNDTEIIVYDEDKTCLSGAKDIYIGCDNKEDNDYDYYKLSLCDTGNHILTTYNVFRSEVSGYTDFVTVSQSDTGTVYETAYSWAQEALQVTYNNDASIYIKNPYTDDTALACEIIEEQKPHQLCARNIANRVRQTSLGEIEIKIDSHKFATLTAEQALSVTQNWDYANGVKMYAYGNENFETDACIAYGRLFDIANSIRKETKE